MAFSPSAGISLGMRKAGAGLSILFGVTGGMTDGGKHNLMCGATGESPILIAELPCPGARMP
jgi:hypothetical protein